MPGSDGPGRSTGPGRLKTRAEFLRAAKGARSHAGPFSLQMARRGGDASPSAEVRFGYTVTKKVGRAVERNRIRRRLREAVRLSRDLDVQPGHDYVLVARRECLSVPFPVLMRELARVVRKVRAGRRVPEGAAAPGAIAARDTAETRR
jgi:ribonuclease P protein component